jgi:2-keto-3-deoxy-L-rhamnonate aldolase RhmA
MFYLLENALALKKRWRAGEVTCGIWMDLVDPCVAELLGGLGYDWTLIDSEHGPIDISTLQTMLIGLKPSKTVPIVRVPWNDQVVIKRTLDVGAMGLVVPLVRTAQDVRDAVSYAKYPPQGIRGCAPRRASDYGRAYGEYLQYANEATIVIVQIEHIDAVRNLDEILAVPGLDAIFVGPADLSNSMGFVGRIDAPEVQKTMDEVLQKAHKAGVYAGLATSGGVEEMGRWVERGVQFLPVTGDRRLLSLGGASILAGMRQWLDKNEKK